MTFTPDSITFSSTDTGDLTFTSPGILTKFHFFAVRDGLHLSTSDIELTSSRGSPGELVQNSREKSRRSSDFSLDRGFTFYQIKPDKNSSNMCVYPVESCECCKKFQNCNNFKQAFFGY